MPWRNLLEPGDSLRLSFEVNVALRDFSNRGVDASVSAKSTFFTNQDWLPAIGYQSSREIGNASVRKAHGLAPRPELPSLYDIKAHPTDDRCRTDRLRSGGGHGRGPGRRCARRTAPDMDRGRAPLLSLLTDAPIGNEYAFFSADYAVHETRWNDVAIQIYHHPRHTANLDRMARSVRASLDYNTEHFGPNQRNYIRLIERPGHAFGLHAESATITYGEGFSLLNPHDDPRGFDLVFATVCARGSARVGSPIRECRGSRAAFGELRVVRRHGRSTRSLRTRSSASTPQLDA